MKHQWIFLLAAAMLLACSACGTNEGAAPSEVPVSPSVSQSADDTTEIEPSAEAEASAEEPLFPANEEVQEDSPKPPEVGSAPEEEAKENPTADPQPDSQKKTTVPVDVDLTTLSSTMVYAEVFNMRLSPDNYIGKNIRMTGIFTVYQDPGTNQIYCGVIAQDATACCAQGLDLVMPEGLSYPRDYPTPESKVTVVGTLQADRTLEKQGIVFLRLENVVFESNGNTP